MLYLFGVWAHFNVSRHISYRFRLVSISCDPSFTFSIDGHQMTIIEVEGTNVKPLTVDSIDIFVGMSASSHLSCCANRCRNRPALLCCRKKYLFVLIQESRPHLSLGYCQPTCCQLLYVSIFLEFSWSDELQTGIRALPPARDFTNNNNLAVLRYAGAPAQNPTVDPTNPPVSTAPLVETDLHVRVL